MIYIHIYIESQVYRHYTYYYQRMLVSLLHVDSKIVDYQDADLLFEKPKDNYTKKLIKASY